MFQVRGPMMVKGDYSSDVTMKLSVWQKDMNVIADFAKANGCPTPLFAATAPLYISATTADPSEDTGAVCAVIEKMANSGARNDADLDTSTSRGRPSGRPSEAALAPTATSPSRVRATADHSSISSQTHRAISTSHALLARRHELRAGDL